MKRSKPAIPKNKGNKPKEVDASQPGPEAGHDGEVEQAGQEAILPPEWYREERKTCGEAAIGIAETLDKSVTTLAGVALGVSMTFIKEVAPERPLRAELVALAWIAWIAALSLSLLSTYCGMCAHYRSVANLDREQREGKPFDKNIWVPLTDALTFVSLVLLIAGFGLFGRFSYVNLKEKTKVTLGSKNTRPEDGTKGGKPLPRPVVTVRTDQPPAPGKPKPASTEAGKK